MAKAARFGVGTSGSGKHTEVKGPGSEGHTGPDGPRIGPGTFAKSVRPEYDRGSGNSGRPGVRNMKRYSEE